MTTSPTQKTKEALDLQPSQEQQIRELLGRMTLAEKIGQMNQENLAEPYISDDMRGKLCAGEIGSILNVVDVEVVNELQRIAMEDSRLGIPLMIGRDVIHGFKTVMPIPLGQAATWNPDVVEEGARVAALEAAAAGINWTFAPMIDISRDARWGRIAESLGEDPVLASELGVAMVKGFQGDDLSAPGSLAACAKHFAGYGEAESGRDYATTNIPENELRNVHLRPFNAVADAGVATFMTSFSDLNGVPASGNKFLLSNVLRDEWQYQGFVVSDYDSVRQLAIHGLTENDAESATAAVTAGVDMEMAGGAYKEQLHHLVESGRIDVAVIDNAVANILRAKLAMGLFDDPYTNPSKFSPPGSERALRAAKEAALQSIVMLKNDDNVLPLSTQDTKSIAVIGPLADAPYEQLGTWIFDGDRELSVTGLDGIRQAVADDVEVHYERAMRTSRSKETEPFDDAVKIVAMADVAVVFLGEEAILSGEAHSRADIDLPGAQRELVRRVREAGKPVIAVVLAGRPITLTNIIDDVDAILFAWHPGTMGGAAIADILFGISSPCGKLPASFPKMVGQIPIYYNQKNSGKPPVASEIVHIDDIDARAPQTSLGMSAFHLDAGFEPLFPFGFGLSYTSFSYDNIGVSDAAFAIGSSIKIAADLTNTGEVDAFEVVQLYVRDLVGNVTRPVRELKGFQRIHLQAGETIRVEFELHSDELAFFGQDNTLIVEPGSFHAWIGGNSNADLQTEFTLVGELH